MLGTLTQVLGSSPDFKSTLKNIIHQVSLGPWACHLQLVFGTWASTIRKIMPFFFFFLLRVLSFHTLKNHICIRWRKKIRKANIQSACKISMRDLRSCAGDLRTQTIGAIRRCWVPVVHVHVWLPENIRKRGHESSGPKHDTQVTFPCSSFI